MFITNSYRNAYIDNEPNNVKPWQWLTGNLKNSDSRASPQIRIDHSAPYETVTD